MESIKVDMDGQIAIIRLSQPKKLNALDVVGWGELIDTAGRLRQADAKAIVLTGEGQGFCSGMDTGSIGKARDQRPILSAIVQPTLLALLELGVPIVSVVDGVAAGAGIGLALLADYRVGTPRTRFVAGFAGRGLVPDAGTGYFVTRLVGESIAGDFFLGGREFRAEDARRHELVNELVSEQSAEAWAIEKARTWSTPERETVRNTLELLRGTRGESLADYLQREVQAQNRVRSMWPSVADEEVTRTE